MQPEIEGLVQVAEIPAEKLEYDIPGNIYVAFEQEDPEELANGIKKKKKIRCYIDIQVVSSYFYQHS